MKKNLFMCTMILSCLSLFPIHSVQAEEGVQETATATLEAQFSPEQVEAWNEEAPKPVVGDWKASGGFVNEAGKGAWTWRDGVICITDAKVSGIITIGHAGIVAAAPYYEATIEANLSTGVKVHYGSWVTKYKNQQVWQVGINSTSVAQDQKAAQWAARQIGKPYNKNFYDVWTRSKFYCSQLVWAAYRDTVGSSADISLNDYGAAIHPYELRDHPNTSIIYRKR